MSTGYRGRLIFPFLGRIARLDPASTSTDPDGTTGPLESGYDDDFREPARIADGTPGGRSARVEREPIDIPMQVEDEDWKTLSMEANGNDPSTTIIAAFHFADLERMGLVDRETGDALCPVIGDRLIGIVNARTKQIEMLPPDVYCVQALPRSFGLGGGRRNLLVATFRERGKGIR